jgi:hypothetical protein
MLKIMECGCLAVIDRLVQGKQASYVFTELLQPGKRVYASVFMYDVKPVLP